MKKNKMIKEEDERDYSLTSVLSHALLGVETSGLYMQNAFCEGDRELKDFLGEAQNQYKQLAERAKDLLSRRTS